VGIDGKKVKRDGVFVDAYSFSVGGGVGAQAALARPISYRCPAEEVPEALERLLGSYMQQREANEGLQNFFRRHSNEELRALLAGEALRATEQLAVGVGD
jgi:sulfite reductase (ferredoxin)